jgi:hypothetical protein
LTWRPYRVRHARAVRLPAPEPHSWVTHPLDLDIGAGNDVQYARPPLKARYAWFDFFRPEYDWIAHFYPSGQPDSDYLRNRIARLTFDLRTGEAQIAK